MKLQVHGRVLSLLLLGSTLGLTGPPAEAQTPLRSELVVQGFDIPVQVTTPPDDASRLFVVERTGRIEVVVEGQILPAPFLDLSAVVSPEEEGSERGLLGIAFHPAYAQNGQFFVSYTRSGDNASIVARYQVSAADPNAADPASGAVIFGPIAQPGFNHNGGGLLFGPDGKLYLGFGDGGPGADPHCNGQQPGTVLGAILRLEEDGTAPADNPFATDPALAPEVWHYGLRNPWRFSFDRLTGDLYIGDVGQDDKEEVNFHAAGTPAGANFGWKAMEGFDCFDTSSCLVPVPPCNDPSLALPIWDYPHGPPGNRAVIGGFVYRGCDIPDLQGAYFFGDFAQSWIFTLRYDGAAITESIDRSVELSPEGTQIRRITSFGEDANGELYFTGRGNGNHDGRLFRIRADAPSLTVDTTQLSAAAGGTQSFDLRTWDCTLGGDAYLLAGSASGTDPGFVVDGVSVPLNLPDPWFSFAVASANAGPWSGNFGVLDAGGRASASLSLPPGLPPNLVGTHLDHAYVVFDLDLGGRAVFASDTTPLDLVP